MFTSRAEHRLLLRIDNADLRLTERGRQAGLVSDERWERFVTRRARYESNLRALEETRVRIATGERVPAAQILRQPDVRLADFAGDVSTSAIDSKPMDTRSAYKGAIPALQIDPDDAELDIASAETAIKYAGYLRRQEAEIARARKAERRRIPQNFPFQRVPGLSREVVQRLSQVQPDTLGQALRIPGVTPAAVAVLAAYVGRVE